MIELPRSSILSTDVQTMIDLRSDTVTKPTPAMRRAMADAEVGDDVYGEDPTINRLQERAAELFEKEAALFVPTGSMGNQTAVKLHTKPGQEVVIEERGHIYNFEMATMSACAITAKSCCAFAPRPAPLWKAWSRWRSLAATIRPRTSTARIW